MVYFSQPNTTKILSFQYVIHIKIYIYGAVYILFPHTKSLKFSVNMTFLAHLYWDWCISDA